jgi:hypothetical protein
LTVKSLDEFREVSLGIVRTGGSLRMVLDGKGWQLNVPHSFYRVIIEVTVCHLEFLRT